MSNTKRTVKVRHNNGKPIRLYPEPTRNDICACGSGKKYKHCHLGDFQGMIKKVQENINEELRKRKKESDV